MKSTDADADGFRCIGPHRIRVELPDVLHARLDGEITRDHVKGFLDTLDLFPRDLRVYLLRDARQGGFPTPEARAFVVRDPRLDRAIAVVTYGASFHTRVIITMVGHAVRVIRPNKPRFLFLDTEAEARAYIEADRARRA